MELIFEMPNGELANIDLQPQAEFTYAIQLNDRTLSAIIEPMPSGQLKITLEGQTVIVQATRTGGQHYIALGGKTIRLEKTTRRTSARRSTAQEGDLSANLPGQVTKILVAEGDLVEKGQTLVILEAMKMEMRIRAPQDGTVKKILCQLGQAIERGQKLVEMGFIQAE